LQTTPGVGPRTAEAVAAYLHNADRFKKGKEVSAYSGLARAERGFTVPSNGGRLK